MNWVYTLTQTHTHISIQRDFYSISRSHKAFDSNTHYTILNILFNDSFEIATFTFTFTIFIPLRCFSVTFHIFFSSPVSHFRFLFSVFISISFAFFHSFFLSVASFYLHFLHPMKIIMSSNWNVYIRLRENKWKKRKRKKEKIKRVPYDLKRCYSIRRDGIFLLHARKLKWWRPKRRIFYLMREHRSEREVKKARAKNTYIHINAISALTGKRRKSIEHANRMQSKREKEIEWKRVQKWVWKSEKRN